MHVNYLAVLVSAVISMFIGFLWYGPLFGKQWMKLSNVTNKQMKEMKKKGVTKNYFWAFIGTFVMAYVLALLIGYLGYNTFGQGAWLGFVVWLGFFATSMLGMMLWEGRSFKLYSIHVLYHLVNLMILGGILAVWV